MARFLLVALVLVSVLVVSGCTSTSNIIEENQTATEEYVNLYYQACPEPLLRGDGACCEDTNGNGVCDLYHRINLVPKSFLEVPNIEKHDSVAVEFERIVMDPVNSFYNNNNYRFHFTIKNEDEKQIKVSCDGIAVIDDENVQHKGVCDFSETIYPNAEMELVGNFLDTRIWDRWYKLVLDLDGELYEFHFDMWSQGIHDCEGSFDIVETRLKPPYGPLEIDIINPTNKRFEVVMAYVHPDDAEYKYGVVGGSVIIEIADEVQTFSWPYMDPGIDEIVLQSELGAGCDNAIMGTVKRSEMKIMLDDNASEKCVSANVAINEATYYNSNGEITLSLNNAGTVPLSGFGVQVAYGETVPDASDRGNIVLTLEQNSYDSYSFPLRSKDVDYIEVHSLECPGAYDIIRGYDISFE